MKRRIKFAGMMSVVCMVASSMAVYAQGDMTAVYEANQPGVLLKSVENYLVNVDYVDDTLGDNIIYVTEDLYAWHEDGFEAFYGKEEQFQREKYQGEWYIDRYIIPFEYDLYSEWSNRAIVSEETLTEQIISWEEQDGMIFVRTGFDEETDLAYAEAFEMPDSHFVMDYELNADTLAVITQSTNVIDKEGTETLLAKMTIEINGEEPSWVTEAMADVKEIEELQVTETRTVTVVIDPGTETERTMSQTVKNGSYVLLPDDLGEYEAYRDAEGTEPYFVEDTKNDEKIYLLHKPILQKFPETNVKVVQSAEES